MRKVVETTLILKVLKLGAVSVGANFFGFLIPIYIGYEYGVSKETDTFFLCYSGILFITTIFSGALKSVIVPFLKERLSERERFVSFISSTFTYGSVVIAILSLILGICTIFLFKWTYNELYWFLFIGIPIVYFSMFNSLCYGILNSIDKYYLAELTPISRTIVIFISIFILKEDFGISAVIIGYNLGEFFKSIHLYFILRYSNKISLRFGKIHNADIKGFIKQGSYQIISTSIVSSNPLIDKIAASFLIVGSVSILDYAEKVFTVLTILLNSFLVILLSSWSKQVIDREFSIAKLHKTLIAVFIISLLGFLLVYIFKDNIIAILYSNIDKSLQEVIAIVLVLNTVGFCFNAVSQVINRASIAFKATNILIKTSVVRVVVNIIFDVLFIYFWGIIGIPIATILTHCIGMITNYYLFRKTFTINNY